MECRIYSAAATTVKQFKLFGLKSKLSRCAGSFESITGSGRVQRYSLTVRYRRGPVLYHRYRYIEIVATYSNG